MEDPLARLHAPVASWFRATFGDATEAQREAIPALAAGENLLVASPTGSGKTLAAFLWLLSELSREHPAAATGPRAIYVSPLKALANDVARNLEAPLAGIRAHAAAHGIEAPDIRVAIRTGDSSPAHRARMLRAPPHILVTTPESLSLLLVSPRWANLLEGVRWVIVDELHDLAPRKRGAQLALALEHLDARCATPPVRIGLSATVAPLQEAAAFLTGGRPCRIVTVAAAHTARLAVELTHPDPLRAKPGAIERARLARIRAIVDANRSTIVFTNTRSLAETIALELGAQLEPEPAENASVDPEHAAPDAEGPVATHHGSMSREERQVVEERLKRGELRCVVASSSLELGLDIKSVDHVVLVGSPRSCARAIQRLGRSRHAVGERPEGTLLVDDPADLAEAFALQALIEARQIEPLRVPDAPLDILAQDAVGAALAGPQQEAAHLALVRRAWPFRAMDAPTLARVLDAEPYVSRAAGEFRPRGPARMVYHTQAGSIVDEPRVRVLDGDRFVGEIEQAFLETIEEGAVFRLAGASWMHAGMHGAHLRVTPARGREPTVPEWRGEGLGMTGLVAAATRETLLGIPNHENRVTAEAWERFREWRSQVRLEGGPGLPAESFLHHDGRRALVVHAVAGRRAHEALARVLALRLGVASRSTDLGFALLGARAWRPTARALARATEAPLEADLRRALVGTPILARRFRHVAIRSFLIPKRHDGASRFARERAAQARLDALMLDQPGHPMIEEAWKEALHDALDLAGAETVRALLARDGLVIREGGPSPLAARVLSRLDDERGREWIREAEDDARGRSAFPP